MNEETHLKIRTLCMAGDEFAEKNLFEQAIQEYQQALSLLPDPYIQYSAATWILTAIGDAYFLKGDFDMAHETFRKALLCPDAVGNPFIHLRLGQIKFELGDSEASKKDLALAYMGGSKEIFDDESPKYFEFLKTFLRDVE
jgi:tetratricopeptide (TPR) repeat protein